MRLENSNDPAVPPRTGRREGCLDLHRVMAVIINDHDVSWLTLDLKPAPNATEIMEALCDRSKRHVKFHPHSNSCERIEDIVLTWHADIQLAKLFAPEHNRKTGPVTLVLDLRSLEISLAAQTVGHQSLLDIRNNSLDVFVIEA